MMRHTRLMCSAMRKLEAGVQANVYELRSVLNQAEYDACIELIDAAVRFVQAKIDRSPRLPQTFSYKNKKYWLCYSSMDRVFITNPHTGSLLISSGFFAYE